MRNVESKTIGIRPRTLAVTLGVGDEHAPRATAAARLVEKLLCLDTFVIGDDHLHLALNDRFSMFERAVSLKFRIFDIVPSHYDRVMLFDCDWRPVRPWNVDELFPDRDRTYVVRDLPYIDKTNWLEREYGLPAATYFNSGWMILPRSADPLLQHSWREYGSIRKLLFNEQCVLNQVLAGAVTYAPESFNILFPDTWPDPAKAMAIHLKENYAYFRGEIEDSEWTVPQYSDPAETILRGLKHHHDWTADVEHTMEVHLVASAYRGGGALEFGGFRGHGALALALAGLEVTSYDLNTDSLHIRKSLLECHGFAPDFITAEGLEELAIDRTFDVVLHDPNAGDPILVELHALWDLKVNPGGVLIVHDVDRLNLHELTSRLRPADLLVTQDLARRQMAYFWKQR